MLVDIKFCSMSICLMVEKLSTVTGSFQVVELNLKQTNKQPKNTLSFLAVLDVGDFQRFQKA